MGAGCLAGAPGARAAATASTATANGALPAIANVPRRRQCCSVRPGLSWAQSAQSARRPRRRQRAPQPRRAGCLRSQASVHFGLALQLLVLLVGPYRAAKTKRKEDEWTAGDGGRQLPELSRARARRVAASSNLERRVYRADPSGLGLICTLRPALCHSRVSILLAPFFFRSPSAPCFSGPPCPTRGLCGAVSRGGVGRASALPEFSFRHYFSLLFSLAQFCFAPFLRSG